MLNLYLFICSREADAVLEYLNDQCGVKKLRVIVFCWGGVGCTSHDADISQIKGWCISLLKDVIQAGTHEYVYCIAEVLDLALFLQIRFSVDDIF